VRVEQVFGVAAELSAAGVSIGQGIERLLGINGLTQCVLQNDAHAPLLHVVEVKGTLAGGIGAHRSIAFDRINHTLGGAELIENAVFKHSFDQSMAVRIGRRGLL